MLQNNLIADPRLGLDSSKHNWGLGA